jgi:CheY-like chemotaxis protein
MDTHFPFETFLHELQKVLQNLYDPAELRKSPLATLLNLENRPNPALALQDTITNAIQSLRPRTDVPLKSNAWRLYHVLTYRYIEQSSQAFVADNMGLSVRQLRREEREGERILAEYLWKKYNLQSKVASSTETAPQPLADLPPQNLHTPDQEQELEWLRESFPSEMVQIQELVDSVLKAITPLAQSVGIPITCQIPENTPPVMGQITVMRQALLNLLLAGLHLAANERIDIVVENTDDGLWLNICTAGDPVTQRGVMPPQQTNSTDFIEMAQKLSDLFGGQMTVSSHQRGSPDFCATLLLPVTDQIPVLIIDDNADTLRLLQRYLSGTPFRFIGLHDPEQTMDVIQELLPRIVVMDVMMPGMDDWELLGRLRAHPTTHDIPIIVCTILPQEQLALALGAAGFIRKPVNRQVFLAELERQSGRASQTRP